MQLVMIEWVDSTFAQGWHSKDSFSEHTESEIVSVGILLYEDDKRLTIVQDISNKQDAGDGITIPKCSIKRIRRLRVKEKIWLH